MGVAGHRGHDEDVNVAGVKQKDAALDLSLILLFNIGCFSDFWKLLVLNIFHSLHGQVDRPSSLAGRQKPFERRRPWGKDKAIKINCSS